MGCSKYAPLLSRFLDEDLASTEIEGLLRHLSSCTACQEGLNVLEKLRYGFQAVGEIESVPSPDQGFLERTMATLVYEERPQGQEDADRVHDGSSKRRTPFSWKGIVQLVFPGQPFPVWARVFRYAVPALIIVILGLLLIPAKQDETIDVASITPSQDLLFPVDQTSQPFETYIFHHATQQPLGTFSDELPLIQEVADSGR